MNLCAKPIKSLTFHFELHFPLIVFVIVIIEGNGRRGENEGRREADVHFQSIPQSTELKLIQIDDANIKFVTCGGIRRGQNAKYKQITTERTFLWTVNG